MFAFTPSPKLKAENQLFVIQGNTIWRGCAAVILCAFGLGCASSASMTSSVQSLSPAPVVKVSPAPVAKASPEPELPPQAAALLANADQLLAVLNKGAPEALNQILSPDADAVNINVFKVTSKTLQRLGKVKHNSIESFQNKNGIYIGQFEVEFEGMKAELTIATKEDKLLAWEFSGEEMESQLSYTFFDSFTELTLIASTLKDAEGNKHEPVFSHGEKLHITLMIAGFERRTNFAHVRLNMNLKNDKGELLRTIKVVDNSLKIKTNEPPAITLNTWLALTEPGNYTVELEVQDVYSNEYLVHAQDIKIKGQPGSALSKVFL